MSTPTPTSHCTAAAVEARRRTAPAAVGRVHDAITRLHKERTPISVAIIARRAGVSRTFLYTNPDAKAAIQTAKSVAAQQHRSTDHSHTDQRETMWRERALNAENGVKAAGAEIRAQRQQIGELLGKVRDMESEWTQDSIHRITTENTTFKQRLRQLTTDHRALEERLQAARSNLRFQDKRIADLEAQLAEPHSPK